MTERQPEAPAVPDHLVMPPDEFEVVRKVAAMLGMDRPAPDLGERPAAAMETTEGIRLWMLDCGELVAKHRARAEAAEAKLAAVKAYCRDECEVVNEGLRLVAIVRASDILAIIGSEEEGGAVHDRDFTGPVL